jgi:hypothetical protein
MDPDAESGPSEVYKAVRAHELMLNEATAAQERTVVPLLLTLNGGASVAYLTLLGALGSDSGSLSIALVWAQIAVVAWMLGLLLAAGAGWAATKRQALLNKAHRLMREQVEAEIDEKLAGIVAPEELTPQARKDEREAARADGETWARRYVQAWIASAGVFVVGALLALIAVSSASVRPGPSEDYVRPGHHDPGSHTDVLPRQR